VRDLNAALWNTVALALLASACARPLAGPILDAGPAGFTIAPGTSAVVIAPHPDDGTLAAGGLIQQVLAGGGTVRLIVLTAGDAYREAASAASGRPLPSADDYRALGRIRAGEEKECTRILGIRDLVLLDGPDGGLEALWTTHWLSVTPYVSPWSGRGPFSGEVLLGGLSAAVAAASPTLVVAPDPRDRHSDHAAAGRFAQAAIESLPEHPRVLTYMVHARAWPPPGDEQPPPPTWEHDGTNSVSLRLTPEQRRTKRRALDAHRSQWRVLGPLLGRFDRRNEVFAVSPRPRSRP
jgi:N-acetyl-1-D-myo-inositol-2-amino-2-deoxy-alpha-D-glucopyranoside deacetylase